MRDEVESATVRAGTLGAGTSFLRWHALREDGTAACSSYLHIEGRTELARDIRPNQQCRSRACQKLFKAAGDSHA